MYDKINVNSPAAYKPVNNSPFNDNRNHLITHLNLCSNKCLLFHMWETGWSEYFPMDNGATAEPPVKKLLPSSDATLQSDNLW